MNETLSMDCRLSFFSIVTMRLIRVNICPSLSESLQWTERFSVYWSTRSVLSLDIGTRIQDPVQREGRRDNEREERLRSKYYKVEKHWVVVKLRRLRIEDGSSFLGKGQRKVTEVIKSSKRSSGDIKTFMSKAKTEDRRRVKTSDEDFQLKRCFLPLEWGLYTTTTTTIIIIIMIVCERD